MALYLGFAIFRVTPTLSFTAALGVMMMGAYLAAFEWHEHAHSETEGGREMGDIGEAAENNDEPGNGECRGMGRGHRHD